MENKDDSEVEEQLFQKKCTLVCKIINLNILRICRNWFWKKVQGHKLALRAVILRTTCGTALKTGMTLKGLKSLPNLRLIC